MILFPKLWKSVIWKYTNLNFKTNYFWAYKQNDFMQSYLVISINKINKEIYDFNISYISLSNFLTQICVENKQTW